MEAGRSFASESPDLQLGEQVGKRGFHSEPRHSQRELEACVGSGRCEGKVHPESRFCSAWTSVRCRINGDFYTVAPWRSPSVDSTVGRLL